MTTFRLIRSIAFSGWLATWLALTSGCLSTRVNWARPDVADPQPVTWTTRHSPFNAVEQRYHQAIQLEVQGCASCVDLFFEVAMATRQHDGPACASCRKRHVHKSALLKLVVAGQRFCRLDPRTGLLIRRDTNEHRIPITHHGFVWDNSHFQQLIPVGDYNTNAMRKLHRRSGVGVPLVVTGRTAEDDRFLPEHAEFAATLQLSVASCREPDRGGQPFIDNVRLELYDPFRIDYTIDSEHPEAIAKDLSAPLAYRLRNDSQSIVENFINPESATGESRLVTVEPYQPGKIPVVLIHGLLSNPYTWVEMINELRAHPGFVDHFQIWVFEYPTGQPFLLSAARLREQLASSRRTFDPEHGDPQLSNAVLVGHSMGGLLAKLQVTSSGDRLWRAVANRPFDQIVMIDDFFEQQLASSFFFEPSPGVSRVIFMATPHRGSAFATRAIGRLGSSLVREPDDRRMAHRQLIVSNPGVFSDEVSERIPTSIDLLEPESQLLQTIGQLPAACHVQMHSIIGNRCCTLLHGRSDGVVPVSSAKESRSITERMVKATHTGVKQHPESIHEVITILQLHLQQAAVMDQVSVDDPTVRIKADSIESI